MRSESLSTCKVQNTEFDELGRLYGQIYCVLFVSLLDYKWIQVLSRRLWVSEIHAQMPSRYVSRLSQISS